jgi:hypothetical protein
MPFRVSTGAGQRAFPDEPAPWSPVLALSPMHAHATGQMLPAAALLIEHGHAAAASSRHAVQKSISGVARHELGRM